MCRNVNDFCRKRMLASFLAENNSAPGKGICVCMSIRRQLSALVVGAALAYVPIPGWSQPAQQTTPDTTQPSQNPDATPGQDMHQAGRDTKNAARHAGRATKNGTKHAYHSTKRHTKKAWRKTKNTAKGAVRGAKEGAHEPTTPDSPQK